MNKKSWVVRELSRKLRSPNGSDRVVKNSDNPMKNRQPNCCSRFVDWPLTPARNILQAMRIAERANPHGPTKRDLVLGLLVSTGLIKQGERDTIGVIVD